MHSILVPLYLLGSLLWVLHYVRENKYYYYNPYNNPKFKINVFIQTIVNGMLTSIGWIFYMSDILEK